jgi:putative mRNA 3-end processing factor
LAAIDATGAGQVWVTHGFTAPVVRWLQTKGIDARAIQTRFEGERDEPEVEGQMDGRAGEQSDRGIEVGG